MDPLSSIQKVSALIGIPLLSGTNLFITVGCIGGLQLWAGIDVPGLHGLARPWVVYLCAGVYILETSAGLLYNWIPGPIDAIKEIIKSFITIPASGILAVMIAHGDSAAAAPVVMTQGFSPDYLTALSFILGALLGSTTQVTKIFVRMLIDHSPEPVSNFLAELSEGTIAVAGLLLIFFGGTAGAVIALSLILIFMVAFAILGPRMTRASLSTYRAGFAIIKYLINNQKTELCDVDCLDPKLAAKIEKSFPLGKADSVFRVIFDKAQGFKANQKGFAAIAQDNLYLIGKGWFRVKSVSFTTSDLKKCEFKEGLLFDYLDLRFPGKRIQLKFIKTWKSDFKLLCARCHVKAEPALQMERNPAEV